MTLNRIPAYTEVVIHGDDQPVTGPVTAVEADGVVATALRRGYLVEPTEQGVLVLCRPTARIVVQLRPVYRPALTRWRHGICPCSPIAAAHTCGRGQRGC